MANLKLGSNAALDKNGFIQNYPVGTIVIRANSTIDDGWLLCDGSYASTADYPELDAHLGTTYGARVGSTFRLPPLVYNVTNNPTQRIPFSTISVEATYPNVFTHNHTVAINATAFSAATHFHNHNSNTTGSNNDNHNHDHGVVSGNTDASGAGAGSAATRLAGPLGPYASGNSGQVNHTHGGANAANTGAAAGWLGGSTGNTYAHSHNVQIHNTTNHDHNHNTNISSSSHSVVSSNIIPLSKQVYFLIKT